MCYGLYSICNIIVTLYFTINICYNINGFYHQKSVFLLILSLIYIALRKEFELDSRYHALSLKVNIVNEDAR